MTELKKNQSSNQLNKRRVQQKEALLWQHLWSGVFKLIAVGSLKVTHADGSVAHYGQADADPVEMIIHEASFYRRVIFGGSMALGECYVEGLWASPDLSSCLSVLAANCRRFGRYQKGLSLIQSWINRLLHLFKQNTKKNSLNNIRAHYDLSNQFYQTFLDPSMTYSSAYYDSKPLSLEAAQRNKINRILDLLEIREGDALLEIGSGWGALALRALKRGASVKTITLSQAQFDYVREKIKTLDASAPIELKLQDYRDEMGLYDCVVSCEMIEAVGKEYLACYFQKIRDVLKFKGKAVLQAITIRDEDYEDYANSCDWIQRYIFPGGHLPSISQIRQELSQIDGIEIVEMHSFGGDYAKTLYCWQERFSEAKLSVEELGFDESFQRKWQYYFSYCIAGFLNKMIDVKHIVLERK